jgi:hypothetical protein
MYLLDQLAARWGIEREPNLVVWFELDLREEFADGQEEAIPGGLDLAQAASRVAATAVPGEVVAVRIDAPALIPAPRSAAPS